MSSIVINKKCKTKNIAFKNIIKQSKWLDSILHVNYNYISGHFTRLLRVSSAENTTPLGSQAGKKCASCFVLSMLCVTNCGL